MGTAVLVFAVLAIAENRRMLVVCSVLAVSATAANWLGRWVSGEPTVIAANLLDLTLLLLVVGTILTKIFRSRDVTRSTLAGAICAYLLIGAVWADIYSLVETAMPGSFSSIGAESTASVGAKSARNLAASFFYFSFVTLSTLGYGDITPLTRPARNLSALEAIVGQLFLAVLVARLVGQLAASRTQK
jgi:hypothetical protein